jgi:hypothetical protein
LAEPCHCEEQSAEAIQLDRHGALRAHPDDKDASERQPFN